MRFNKVQYLGHHFFVFFTNHVINAVRININNHPERKNYEDTVYYIIVYNQPIAFSNYD